ncbi:hypothetical protein EJ05DRAFT_493519 [Pseudovirgaria hyperparasitica]|uniref:Uncharacterized protein n=1 Tax=Pseudovirgaria hyperparasitica TaxID=470096 RepID=A0A6A6W3D3_9PEZI|nr:uncharacterized protein EJ05DRAFT_493519 [Pseudovirgaria hyperparasitica]KAF2757113.1 hypothetical protein EJ05DRAFT_493519 [Pseudovirgaria hyperparasitica]
MISSRRPVIVVVFVFIFLVLFQTRIFLATPINANGPLTGGISGIPAPPSNLPPDNLSKVVVIASTKDEDTSWLEKDVPDVKSVIYKVDDPTAEFTVPMNKGHEGMVYLTYLIDNYDNLPDVMAFMHAHKIAWHNNDLFASDAAQMLRALSAPHVKRQGYFNMRCHWDPGCPDWMHPYDPSNRTDISKPEERELALAFKQIFPNRDVPETIATPCCAQFALSKEAVLKVPIERLEAYRQWIINTPLHDLVSGRVWEYLWHYIFTEYTPVVCQAMDKCYCDGYGVCFGGDEAYKNFTDRWNDMRLMQISLSSWTKEFEESKDEMSKPAIGVKDQLERKIKEASRVVWAQVAEAKTRGQDPQARALDSGRKWKPGDGY